MKILYRPGLVLISGLIVIAVSLTLLNWQIAQRNTASRADYFEQRVLGVSQRAASLEERYEALLATHATLAKTLAETEALYHKEKAANTPLRDEIREQLASRIKLQGINDNRQRTITNLRKRIEETEAELKNTKDALEEKMKRVDTFSAEQNSLKQELMDAKTQQETLEARLKALSNAHDNLKKEADTLRRTEAEHKAVIARMSATMEAMAEPAIEPDTEASKTPSATVPDP